MGRLSCHVVKMEEVETGRSFPNPNEKKCVAVIGRKSLDGHDIYIGNYEIERCYDPTNKKCFMCKFPYCEDHLYMSGTSFYMPGGASESKQLCSDCFFK